MPGNAPADVQLWYWILTFFGLPLIIIYLGFRGWWRWGREVEKQFEALRQHYEDRLANQKALYEEALAQRDKRLEEKDRTIEALKAEYTRGLASLNEQNDKRVEDLKTQWREQLAEAIAERNLWRKQGEEQADLLGRITKAIEKGLDALMKNIAQVIESSIEAALRKGP